MDFTKEAKENMIFTNHILERFVERTMNKTGTEMKQYLAQNEDKVKEQILKLYEYSELFWYGKIKEHDFTYFTINRDGWVFVIGKDKITLITVYKVDLGLSTEFNKQYIQEIKNYVEKEMTEIETFKNKCVATALEAKEEIETIKDNIKTLKQEIALNEETQKLITQDLIDLMNRFTSDLETNEEKIKLIESDQQYKTDTINLKEKQLHQKIEKFIGAKIFEK